jgi:hypothetical protein
LLSNNLKDVVKTGLAPSLQYSGKTSPATLPLLGGAAGGVYIGKKNCKNLRKSVDKKLSYSINQLIN